MLTYAYECPSCGPFEVQQRMSDPRLETCPTCSSEVKRIISGGSGFLMRSSSDPQPMARCGAPAAACEGCCHAHD